jgi:hypothetical protein
VACDAQTLATNAKCLAATFSSAELQAIRIYLWCQYLAGNTVSCDPQTLADASACILEKLSKGERDAVETSLACSIAASGGGGGSTGVTAADYGGAEPSFTPATDGAVAIDTSDGHIWWWFNGVWN